MFFNGEIYIVLREMRVLFSMELESGYSFDGGCFFLVIFFVGGLL